MPTHATSQSALKAFVDLPPEARNQVYEAVLTQEIPYILPDDHYDNDTDHLAWDQRFHPVHKYCIGLYKPFSYQNTQWRCRGSSGDFLVFEESIARHPIPAICHVNRQIRVEAMSLFIQEKLYVGLEGKKHCAAGLDEFCTALPEDVIKGIRKLNVGMRADVKNKKHASDHVPLAQLRSEGELEYNESWDRETDKDEITGIWPLVDMSQTGLPAFQLSILQNTIQVKTHYALIPNQASEINQELQRFRYRGVDGETLFHIAKWLRNQDAIDAFETDGCAADRFRWQFEAEGHEVVFHEREMLKGQFREWYSPKKPFGHVVASVEFLGS